MFTFPPKRRVKQWQTQKFVHEEHKYKYIPLAYMRTEISQPTHLPTQTPTHSPTHTDTSLFWIL